MHRAVSLYKKLSSFRRFYAVLGMIGLTALIIGFIVVPSYPTPDKILLLIIFGGMIVSQAQVVVVRFVPFVALLYVYEAFRGVADHFNHRVNYMFMPDADRFLFFGTLPTAKLQEWLWHGQVQWYDFVLYLAYMAHFIMPLALAVIVWKKFPSQYWRVIATYVLLSFAGFLTYLLFPAAPPWMASDMQLIEPIERISSDVWFALGVQDFATVYSKVSANAVAAVPSLHSAYALTFALFVTTLFKSRYKHLAWIFPALIGFGTVYQGEHYVIDALLGWLYALVAFAICRTAAPRVGARLGASLLVRKLRQFNSDIV